MFRCRRRPLCSHIPSPILIMEPGLISIEFLPLFNTFSAWSELGKHASKASLQIKAPCDFARDQSVLHYGGKFGKKLNGQLPVIT